MKYSNQINITNNMTIVDTIVLAESAEIGSIINNSNNDKQHNVNSNQLQIQSDFNVECNYGNTELNEEKDSPNQINKDKQDSKLLEVNINLYDQSSSNCENKIFNPVIKNPKFKIFKTAENIKYVINNLL